ncbi:uncharacterized protein [Amphiura filiformis]|uniref:uncharacterized protein n=1 Tax=Amphiura filiformis TaxID=82378 RepID=UPI003B22742C
MNIEVPIPTDRRQYNDVVSCRTCANHLREIQKMYDDITKMRLRFIESVKTETYIGQLFYCRTPFMHFKRTVCGSVVSVANEDVTLMSCIEDDHHGDTSVPVVMSRDEDDHHGDTSVPVVMSRDEDDHHGDTSVPVVMPGDEDDHHGDTSVPVVMSRDEDDHHGDTNVPVVMFRDEYDHLSDTSVPDNACEVEIMTQMSCVDDDHLVDTSVPVVNSRDEDDYLDDTTVRDSVCGKEIVTPMSCVDYDQLCDTSFPVENGVCGKDDAVVPVEGNVTLEMTCDEVINDAADGPSGDISTTCSTMVAEADGDDIVTNDADNADEADDIPEDVPQKVKNMDNTCACCGTRFERRKRRIINRCSLARFIQRSEPKALLASEFEEECGITVSPRSRKDTYICQPCVNLLSKLYTAKKNLTDGRAQLSLWCTGNKRSNVTQSRPKNKKFIQFCSQCGSLPVREVKGQLEKLCNRVDILLPNTCVICYCLLEVDGNVAGQTSGEVKGQDAVKESCKKMGQVSEQSGPSGQTVDGQSVNDTVKQSKTCRENSQESERSKADAKKKSINKALPRRSSRVRKKGSKYGDWITNRHTSEKDKEIETQLCPNISKMTSAEKHAIVQTDVQYAGKKSFQKGDILPELSQERLPYGEEYVMSSMNTSQSLHLPMNTSPSLCDEEDSLKPSCNLTEPGDSSCNMTQSSETSGNETQPGETSGNVTQPGKTSHNVTQPVETSHNVTQPDETSGDVTQPGETSRNVTQPGETFCNETQPGETFCNVTQPCETSQNVTQLGETSCNVTQPGETSCNLTQPCETFCNETQSDETSHNVTTQPGETSRNVTQPCETFCNETQHGETSRNETQPGETSCNVTQPDETSCNLTEPGAQTEMPYQCRFCWQRFQAESDCRCHVLHHVKSQYCENKQEWFDTNIRPSLEVFIPKKKEEPIPGEVVDISALKELLIPEVVALLGPPLCQTKPYRCLQCSSKDFRPLNRFLSHMSNAHGLIRIDKPWTCRWCPELFATREASKKHVCVWKKQACTLACHKCDKSLTVIVTLAKHRLKVHLGKRFMCSVCGQRYYKRKHLSEHIHRHHYKARPFQCRYCPKKWATENHRQTHESVIHFKKGVQMCDICGIQVYNLPRHIATHSDSRNYACERCPYRAEKLQFLKRHIFRCHGDISEKEVRL